MAQFYRALFIDRSLLAEEQLSSMLEDPIGIGYGMGVDVEADGLHLGHSGSDVGLTSDVRLDMATGRIAVELISSYYADADWPREVLDFEALGLLNPCPYTGDCDCDEPNGLGFCEWRTDTADCSDPNSYFGSGSGFAGALSGTAAQDYSGAFVVALSLLRGPKSHSESDGIYITFADLKPLPCSRTYQSANVHFGEAAPQRRRRRRTAAVGRSCHLGYTHVGQTRGRIWTRSCRTF